MDAASPICGSSRNLVAVSKIAWVLKTVVLKDINTHYSQLLGLDSSWQVSKVDLAPTGNQVVIQLVHSGGKLAVPIVTGNAQEKIWHPSTLGVTWIRYNSRPN